MALRAHAARYRSRSISGLCQDAGIALERALGLCHLRLIGAWIDIDQWIALVNELPFTVVNRGHQAGDLRGDRRGVDGSDRADGFEIDTDIPFLSGGYGDGDRSGDAAPLARWSRGFLVVLMIQNQNQDQRKSCDRYRPYQKAPPFRFRGIIFRRQFVLGVSGMSGGIVFHLGCLHQQVSTPFPMSDKILAQFSAKAKYEVPVPPG